MTEGEEREVRCVCVCVMSPSAYRTRYLWPGNEEGSCHSDLQGECPFDQEGHQVQGTRSHRRGRREGGRNFV